MCLKWSELVLEEERGGNTFDSFALVSLEDASVPF